MYGSLQLGTRPLSAAHSEMVQTAGPGPAATQNWAPLGPESAQRVLSNQRFFVEEQDLLSPWALVISWGPEKSCFYQWAHSFLAYELEQELNNTAFTGCIKLKFLSLSSPTDCKTKGMKLERQQRHAFCSAPHASLLCPSLDTPALMGSWLSQAPIPSCPLQGPLQSQEHLDSSLTCQHI